MMQNDPMIQKELAVKTISMLKFHNKIPSLFRHQKQTAVLREILKLPCGKFLQNVLHKVSSEQDKAALLA